MDYTAESLIPVMAHIAKNVVKVNDGLTKHMVSCKNNLHIIAPNLQADGTIATIWFKFEDLQPQDAYLNFNLALVILLY